MKDEHEIGDGEWVANLCLSWFAWVAFTFSVIDLTYLVGTCIVYDRMVPDPITIGLIGSLLWFWWHAK